MFCFFCSPHRNMPEEIFLFISFACKATKNLRPSGSKLCCLLSVVDYLFPLRRSSFLCYTLQLLNAAKREKNLVELRLAIISTKSNAIFPPLRSFASSLSLPSISTSFHFETEHRVPQLINDSHALHHFGARSVCRHIVPRRQQFSLIKLSPRGSENWKNTDWTRTHEKPYEKWQESKEFLFFRSFKLLFHRVSSASLCGCSLLGRSINSLFPTTQQQLPLRRLAEHY